MKHSSMDSTRDMPEHLLFDILLWLPVTSLLRFKSVCKSWFTLINSPSFISQHFDHNSGNDNLLCIYRDIVSDGCHKFCLLSGNKYEVYNDFDCGLPSLVDGKELTFSSNGIICLVHDGTKISLWNPAMKQLRSLSVRYQSFSFFGFGFNVKSNDHIIVRTTLCNRNTSHSLVDVYSLRADSWRTMLKDFAIPFRFYSFNTYHITKDGTCFWIAFYPGGDGDDDGDFILSFDLNEETYETMSLPVRKVHFPAVIDFLGDKLAYIHGVDDRAHLDQANFEIWVLHEYGVRESWNKQWKIGPTYRPGIGALYPLWFVSNGEFLLLTNQWFRKNSGVFYLYNLSTEENEYLKLHQPNFWFLWSVRYAESLFPVKKVQLKDYLDYVSRHGGMGVMLVGGAAAAAAAYGAHQMHGHGAHGVYSHGVSFVGGHVSHGKFKHGKHGKHGHGKFKKWK